MEPKVSVLNILTTISSAVSFIGQLISVYFPRWWIVETKIGNVTETAHFGLWKTIDCLDNACTETLSNPNNDKAWIEGVKVVEVFAIIFLFAATGLSIMTIIWGNSEERLPRFRKLFTAFSGAAGTVIVMGVLIFYKKKTGLSPSQAIATKDGNADWALIVSSISGVLSIVCAMLIGCKILMKDDDIDDETDYSYWYTMQSQHHSKNKSNRQHPPEKNNNGKHPGQLHFQKF